MQNAKEFIKNHLVDQRTGAFKLDCGHISYPGCNIVCFDNHYFCDEICFGEWLISNKYSKYTIEKIPHINREEKI